MKRAIPIFLAALLVFAGWLAVLLRDPSDLEIDDPRFEQARVEVDERLLPSVLRYLSKLDGFADQTSFGLVLEANQGTPSRVLNLSAVHPEIGSSIDTFISSGGFELADRLFDPDRRKQENADRYVETIDPLDLATVIRPPVDISTQQLSDGERLVIGVGFNYQEHREETETKTDKFLFAKFVEPTGPYSPVSLGANHAPLSGERKLVDYEAEIGFVLLEDVDLANLPASFEELRQVIAFLSANDITDRAPLILDGKKGYPAAKSAPSFLPIGPWMVHGRHIDLRSRTSGMETVDLRLRVEEQEPAPRGQWRQHSSSSQMIRGPLEILKMAAEMWSSGEGTDSSGAFRGIVHQVGDRAMIPAGSLILTGTPGGTAIESPTNMDRLRLIALGNLSMRGARVAFAAHCVRNRQEMGFLSVGDRVETHIQHLGRQVWDVVP